MPAILSQVLSRASQLGERGAVLFDLDSTLLDNRPRQARILRAGCSRFSPVRPSTSTVGRSGCAWPRRTSTYRSFWRERFFTSEYCVDDVATVGAVEYVRRVLATGARVIYCIGCHPAMREGTLQCFARQGFPLPEEPRITLLMKPHFEMRDDE